MTHSIKSKRTKKRVPMGAKIIGANLRYLRVASGFSQQDIGRILKISYQQVQKYELGHNRFPIEKLHRLREFYDVPYDVFFRGFSDVEDDSELTAITNQDLSIYVKLGCLQDHGLKKKIESILFILLH